MDHRRSGRDGPGRADAGVSFYSGDTALHPLHLRRSERVLGHSMSRMESGAYNRGFWADVHLGPEQAVIAHRMVGGNVGAIPVHWGLLILRSTSWTEPSREGPLPRLSAPASMLAYLARPGASYRADQEPRVDRCGGQRRLGSQLRRHQRGRHRWEELAAHCANARPIDRIFSIGSLGSISEIRALAHLETKSSIVAIKAGAYRYETGQFPHRCRIEFRLLAPAPTQELYGSLQLCSPLDTSR